MSGTTSTTRKTQARDVELLSVGSHSVTGKNRHWANEIDREECYPRLTGTWRGAAVTIDAEANRYRFSDGDWSEWRIYVTRAQTEDRAEVSGTARAALNEEVRPLVTAWLASSEYRASRQRAFYYLVRNALQQERYSTEGIERGMATHRAELRTEDRQRLERATKALAQFLKLIAL